MHFLNVGHAYENAARYTRAVIGETPDPTVLPTSYREARGISVSPASTSPWSTARSNPLRTTRRARRCGRYDHVEAC